MPKIRTSPATRPKIERAILVRYTKYPQVWYRPKIISKIIKVCVIELIPNLVNFDKSKSSTCGAKVDPGAPLTLARRVLSSKRDKRFKIVYG